MTGGSDVIVPLPFLCTQGTSEVSSHQNECMTLLYRLLDVGHSIDGKTRR